MIPFGCFLRSLNLEASQVKATKPKAFLPACFVVGLLAISSLASVKITHQRADIAAGDMRGGGFRAVGVLTMVPIAGELSPQSAPDNSSQSSNGMNLSQNFPNPFNPITSISFGISESAHIKLAVFDVTGSLVVTLVDRYLESGIHRVTFDGSGFPSGVYFYTLEGHGARQTKKLVLLK